MSKLTIPETINLSKNAKKNLQEIEKTKKYDLYISRIQEYINFVATTPTDLFGARQRGWTVEKLKTSKKVQAFSIRISGGDRFTYSIQNGQVTIEGLIGHYKNTPYEAMILAKEEELVFTARKYIDLLDKRIDNNLNSKSTRVLYEKVELSKINLINEKTVLNKDNYKITDNIIESLLRSKDRSTFNLGRLLRVIKDEFYDVYMDIVSDIYNYLDTVNNDIVFTGYPISDISLTSTIIMLKHAFYKDSSKKIGIKTLNKFLNGSMDNDREFYRLNSLVKTYSTNTENDRLNDVLRALVHYYEKENKEEALDNMRKLTVLVTVYGLRVSATEGLSCYMPGFNVICLCDALHSDLTIIHELGHAIDAFYGVRDKTTKDEYLFANARKNIRYNPRSEEIIKESQERIRKIKEETNVTYEMEIISRYGSVENAINRISQDIDYMIRNGRVKELFIQYNIPQEMRKEILEALKNNNFDLNKTSRDFYELIKKNFLIEYLYGTPDFIVSDIISAIYGGVEIELKSGQKAFLEAGHDSYYYESHPDNSMCEIYANINALLVSGRYDLIDKIKDLVGEDFFNYIMKEHFIGRLNKEKNIEYKKDHTK